MALKIKVELELTKTERVGVKKTLEKILAKLRNPKNWVQEELEIKNEETGEFQYCLLGAVQNVDGPYENLTQAYMLMNPPKGWEFDLDNGISEIVNGGNLSDFVNELGEEIAEFNDHRRTTHKEIITYLKQLIKKVSL